MISETGGNRLGKIVVDTKQECATNTLEKSGNSNINCEFLFEVESKSNNNFENAFNDVIKKALTQIIVTYSGVPKGPDGVEIVCGAHSRGIQPVQWSVTIS